MAGYKILLICLIVICYIAGGCTRESNPCYPEIPCDDGECIDRTKWCNRRSDCPDGSDEKYCETSSFWGGSPDHKCDKVMHFECYNEQCVPLSLRCDGFDDCKDKSDEKDCGKSEEDRSETESTEEASVETREPEQTTTIEPIESSTARTYVHRPSPPPVDHYDMRIHEVDNQRRGVVPRQHSSSHYNGPRRSGSDTSPTYYYPPYWQTYPDANRGAQIPVPHPRDTRVGYDSRQLWPEIHQPRAVIHSQRQYGPVPQRKRHRRGPLTPFHFREDYAQGIGYRQSRVIQRAHEWLLGRKDRSYGWGEDTPRALVALSLLTNSFPSNVSENDILRRELKLEIGAKLLRDVKKKNSSSSREVNSLSDSRLALYINALLATCQDPRWIYEQDLVEMLYNRIHDARRRNQPSPFVFLTLCLSESPVSYEDLHYLKRIVDSYITDEVSKDRFILATSALACIHKRGLFENELRDILRAASSKLIEQQSDDGSFGNIYSTALAAQAFIALDSNVWNADKTLNYLTSHQLDDGSFGDMLATYLILPVISGRSLVHLRNTQCIAEDDETSSEEDIWAVPTYSKSILYSLAIGYPQRNSIALHMTVPADANFFQIMEMAQKRDHRFKFLYAESYGKVDVHTLSGIPNDPERGTYWNLYVLDRRSQTVDIRQIYYGDIRRLVPEDSQELLFWYFDPKLPFYGR